MDNFTNWLITNGVSYELLLLLITIPVTATLTNLARYVIGIKTLGIYSTIILALAYILAGAKLGVVITILVVITTLLTHSLLKRIRMHYLSRVAINYTLIAIVMAIFYLTINYFPQLQMEMDFQNLNPLAIILIASLSDFILKISIKKDTFTIAKTTFETIIIALLGWSIIRFDDISSVLLNNLWIIIILVIVNFLIGKSTSLRLLDHLRFKQILDTPKAQPAKKIEEPKK